MSTSGYEHILEELRYQCDLPNEERIAIICRRSYVPHPRAVEIITATKALIKHPDRDFARCLAAIGPPGFGKSAILDRLEALYPKPTTPPAGVRQLPLLRVNVPGDVDIGTLACRILRELDEPHNAADRPNALLEDAFTALSDAGVLVLMLDEFHNLFLAKPQLSKMMAVVRDIPNTLKLGLVCAGTQDAENCIIADAQLEERFDRFHLEPWTATQEFRNFVGSLESRLPLCRPSHLTGSELLPLLLRVSEGRMNRLVWTIRYAACAAVSDKSEGIREAHIRAAALKIISARRKVGREDMLEKELAGA